MNQELIQDREDDPYSVPVTDFDSSGKTLFPLLSIFVFFYFLFTCLIGPNPKAPKDNILNIRMATIHFKKVWTF